MKIIKWLEKLNLQLFEGDGAAAGAGDGDGAGEATGVEVEAAAPVNPKRLKRNPLANVRYGKQDDPQPEPQQEEGSPDQVPDRRAEWERLKKEYASEYGADVQSTIQQRFKNQRDQSDELNGLRTSIAPVMQQLAKNSASRMPRTTMPLLPDSWTMTACMSRRPWSAVSPSRP